MGPHEANGQYRPEDGHGEDKNKRMNDTQLLNTDNHEEMRCANTDHGSKHVVHRNSMTQTH